MKNLILFLTTTLFLVLMISKTFGQSTSANGTNIPTGANQYLGWAFGVSLDLNIKNEDAMPIKFYTNAGTNP